jgi:hypothetical protein
MFFIIIGAGANGKDKLSGFRYDVLSFGSDHKFVGLFILTFLVLFGICFCLRLYRGNE